MFSTDLQTTKCSLNFDIYIFVLVFIRHNHDFGVHLNIMEKLKKWVELKQVYLPDHSIHFTG